MFNQCPPGQILVRAGHFLFTPMRPIKIAIPAQTGSFHHHAASNYFGEGNSMLHCADMRAVLSAVNDNLADYAVLACENTSAGIFPEPYRLIFESGLFIIDELHHRVSLCLAGPDEINVNQITQIYSHPYALLQLDKQFHPGKLLQHIATCDTTTAAEIVGSKSLADSVCVCEETVARNNNLQILMRDIQKCNPNYTRFFVIGKGCILHEQFDKIIGAWNHSPIILSALTGKWNTERRIITHNESVFFELTQQDGWSQNQISLLQSQGARIFGYSRARKPNEPVNNPIHISL